VLRVYRNVHSSDLGPRECAFFSSAGITVFRGNLIESRFGERRRFGRRSFGNENQILSFQFIGDSTMFAAPFSPCLCLRRLLLRSTLSYDRPCFGNQQKRRDLLQRVKSRARITPLNTMRIFTCFALTFWTQSLTINLREDDPLALIKYVKLPRVQLRSDLEPSNPETTLSSIPSHPYGMM